MADLIQTTSTNATGLFAAWSVSSSKPGFEVEQLTDPSTSTFWQSEGPQPHHINIQFPRRMAVAQISIFVDIGLDDSYTPHKVSIRAGTHHADLQEVRFVELENPRGWCNFQLGNIQDDEHEQREGEEPEEKDYSDPEALAIRANLIQIAILGNHLNGKDTHVRHVRIFAPKKANVASFDLDGDELGSWTSEVMKMHQTIR